MSEAESHMIRMRLIGGIHAKARRGELKMRLPVGFIYSDATQVIRNPDKQIQQSFFVFFETFRRTGTASATVKSFRDNGLLFPRMLHYGPHKGDVVWGPLNHNRALQVLHNPRYAGAFAYGRTTTRGFVDGVPVRRTLPIEQWHTLIKNAHEGYIGWEEYEGNRRILQENTPLMQTEEEKTPPREGPALLQGIAICGTCGRRMTVRYHLRNGNMIPDYVCQNRRIAYYEPVCQAIPGGTIDEAIGELLFKQLRRWR